jgi:hypothetical protein
MARRMPLKRVEVLVYVLYFGNAFVSAVFFTRLRFRIPYDVMLMPITAFFIMNVVLAWFGRTKTRETQLS